MSEVLRSGLLDGLAVLMDRPGSTPDGRLAEALRRLGAEICRPEERETRLAGGADALVLDCSAWSPPEGEPGAESAEPLLDLLDGVWALVLAVAVEGFIPRGQGGRILFIAPADGTRTGAGAAAAALENLARTLSVEWARHSVTAVTLVPGAAAELEDLAAVVAYLLSPAGAYFSGARLDLGSLSR
ncbi:MAG TPA: hypothetical protein VG321_01180 [Solirubrobacteraceae bacterium]|jgi:NAD(P)-dependent dehydrogenase (short-subunit alcohol dehydrogenase family)|nr:hypothetical protein [Solirubrobacteraceae bacterium]